jgi:hypothetical protein
MYLFVCVGVSWAPGGECVPSLVVDVSGVGEFFGHDRGAELGPLCDWLTE